MAEELGQPDGPDGRGTEERPDGGPNRGAAAIGATLILVGLFFLIAQWVPGLKALLGIEYSWPLIVIGVGVFLALIGLLTGAPETLIPAAIVGGIGGILYWQNLTGNWGSWSYVWTLIPGFVGLGMVLAAFFRGTQHRARQLLTGGLWQVVISLVLFGVFGSFLGGPPWLTRYWPVGIILLGIIVLLRPGRRVR